ncbi:MAG TPA: diaminopimelate epimerase [Chloroflexota bacterium]|jgi:diaminopimelate epimerase
MDFMKMHGLGNDFVLFDCLSGSSTRTDAEWAALAEKVCDRHFGVGADGILVALPSECADVRMRIWNGDGSEAEMCGNGVRCLARYARDRGMATDHLRVETLAGLLELTFPGGAGDVRVDMGPPRLAPREIPVHAEGDRALAVRVPVNGRALEVACVSMGNPHAVTFIGADELAALPLHEIGPLVERHELFPERTNFHAVAVASPHSATVRVWERGVGPTLACGTGACAVTVAGVLSGRLASPVDVTLPGGTLRIEWEQGGSVFMTGPTEYVFRGTWL